MGADLFRKFAISSVTVCYRSVVRHPFLVGMIVFLFSIYRLFPFLFSVLVSASPVLVSTAVLLGTLLSFGQPNIPEIEKESEPESEIRKLESKVVGHAETVGSFDFGETNGSRIEVVTRVNDDNLVDDGLLELGEVKSERGEEKVVLGSRYSPLRQSEDEHIVLESDKLWEGSADPLNSNSGLLWKGVERSGGDDDDDDDEEEEDEDDGSESGDSGSDAAESSSPDASMADIIPMLDELHPLLSEEQETHQPSHMSRVVSQHSVESSDTSSESNDDSGTENHENLKNRDDDKESEHVDKEDETRSPITWTEDDQKNLVNLGTLEMERNRRLEDLIARRRARDDAGVESFESLKLGDAEDEDEESEHVDKEDDTKSAITWTEDDQKNLMNLGTSELERNRRLEDLIARRRAHDDTSIENHENSKSGDDEDDDKESERVDKEDDTRSAITWTEDDQKNLMNLGTSELERNRRLENLIARRRARKSMRMQAERNIMDLESADLPWNIPPISTSRKNPFDYDANDNIPGSAPSVMLQRRNPFDLPYDSSEEKPDLVGDTFEQEFATFQPKEPVFRRHESFNVGPSVFGASRSERQESRLKPYFVPERSFATFQRQFSGLSESKTSSVPDTESVSSDPENKDDNEEDEHGLEAEHASEADEHVSDHESHLRPYFVPEHVASDETGFASFQRQISEVSDSKAAESVSSDLENKDDNDEEEHASEVDEHVSDHESHVRPYFVPEHIASDGTNFSSFQRQLSEVSDSKVSSESVSSVSDIESKEHIDLSLQPDLISLEDHEHVSESFEEGGVEPMGHNEAETTVESVTHQQELQSSVSSLSSLDEASEQIYNDKEGDEVAPGSVSETNYFLDRGSSIERSETDVTSFVVEESQPNEPVYDLSPRSVTRNLSSSSIIIDLHKDESFHHIDDHDQSPSSASDVKWNSTESSSETRDAQNQVPAVPDNEDNVLTHLAVDNISTPDGPVLEAENVVLLQEVQVSTSDSHARSLDSFHQEDVMSRPDEESLLDRSSDQPLAEDPEELQAHDLGHGEVTLPSSEAQSTEVVHEETYENHSPTHGEDILQQEKELPLLDTSVNEPSEDNLEVLQVQTTSNKSDNLQIQEHNVVEVADTETKAQEIPAYASDTYSIESNIDDVDVIKEFDEDLLVELDAVGDFSVKDFGSTSNDIIEDPHTSEHDSENKGIAEEDSYNNDLESDLSEVKQYSHVSEHDLETSHSVEEVSYSMDLGSAFDEMKQEYDVETKSSGDEESGSKDLGTTVDEMKQDPRSSGHDLATMHSEEIKYDPHALDRDLETKHSEEIKQDPHALDHDLETKQVEEMEQDTYASDHDLESKHPDEMKHDPHALDHDLETKKVEEIEQDTHASDHDLESKHSEEMKQDTHALDHDLETKYSEDGDSHSKDANLDEMKQNPHESSHNLETKHSEDKDSSSKDLGSTMDEAKQDLHALDHDLETKHSEDEEFYSKDATLNEMKQDPHDSSRDLETKHSGDEDSYSNDLGSTLNVIKQGPDETNQSINEDSFHPKDLDTTYSEMKEGAYALEHRLETFYSVDENFYSKHVESAFNEMKQDLQASDQDIETHRSGETEVTMDAEVTKSQNENDINNTNVQGAFQAETSVSKLGSDADEVVLPQETESTTSLANSTNATTVNTME